LFVLVPFCVNAQDVLSQNRYLRMTNGVDAITAMRFDLAAYRDTLRTYRTALDGEVTSISAIERSEQDRRARLGSLRDDIKALDKEIKTSRKGLRRLDMSALPRSAEQTEVLIGRVRSIRSRLLQQGVSLR
jgi:hypothetical protein